MVTARWRKSIYSAASCATCSQGWCRADDLRAGLFGRAAIPVGQFSALRIPAGAVVNRGQLEIVFVVDNNQAHLRLVKTGKLLGDEIEVLSGITTNELVVVEGLTGLLDGQPVKTID